MLGADLWQTQREILTAVGQHGRVAVKACHAYGKSYAIAIAVLWWLAARRDGIVVTTAPTWLQVEKVIWGEIKSAVLRSVVRDWPVDGVAFTFHVPSKGEHGPLVWDDLHERDAVLDRVSALKRSNPSLIKSNVETLEMMKSGRALNYTGERGENCAVRAMLPLYMGDGGNFERTFCCYGNDVDCTRCGAYGVFNAAYHRIKGGHAED